MRRELVGRRFVPRRNGAVRCPQSSADPLAERMNITGRTRTTFDVRGGGTPSDGSNECSRALPLLLTAWQASSLALRVAAVAVGAVAVVATTRDAVPLISGIAVALLVPAALIDHHERRLPDRIVGPAAVALLLGTILAPLTGADLPIRSGIAGIMVFAGPLLLLHLISPSAMGFGDVKTAIVLGFALGLVHWQLALAALALATGFTAAVGLLAGLGTIAFGPGLVTAAAVALVTATTFAPITSDPSPPTEATSIHLQLDRPTGVDR